MTTIYTVHDFNHRLNIYDFVAFSDYEEAMDEAIHRNALYGDYCAIFVTESNPMTGELLVIFSNLQEDEPEEDWDDEPCDLEVGFDPYAGCYSFDC